MFTLQKYIFPAASELVPYAKLSLLLGMRLAALESSSSIMFRKYSSVET